MKISRLVIVVLTSLISSLSTAQAQAPVISSFSQNGVLVCTNLQPGTVASVEWASSLSGPWQTNWAGLDTVTVNSNTTISVSVPMFYRVRGVAIISTPPAWRSFRRVRSRWATTWMARAMPSPLNVTVSAFYMDTNLVSYSQWQSVYNWATNNGYGFDHAGSGKAANHPVQTVNWYDVVKWSNARSQQAGLTPVYYTDAGLTQVYTNGDVDAVYANWAANGYRLPTEAEWEKAARGGLSGQRFPWGNVISETNANYYGNTGYSYDLGPNGWNPIGNYPADSVLTRVRWDHLRRTGMDSMTWPGICGSGVGIGMAHRMREEPIHTVLPQVGLATVCCVAATGMATSPSWGAPLAVASFQATAIAMLVFDV